MGEQETKTNKTNMTNMTCVQIFLPSISEERQGGVGLTGKSQVTRAQVELQLKQKGCGISHQQHTHGTRQEDSRRLTCVKPFVDLQVLRASKLLSTAGKGAGEGFLARVDSDMVDQLVLRLEGLLLTRAILPVARMVRDLRPSNVVDGQVGDDVVHRVELLVAALAPVLLVDPLTSHLLLDRLAHVPEERAAHPVHVARVHVVLSVCPVAGA